VLASAAGGLLLAGCSAGSGETGGGRPAAERLRARAARDSERLAAHYDAVVAAHPGLAERLRPLRAEVVRHARAFGGGSGAASPSASVSASVSPVAVPADEKQALASLAAAERALADRRTAALLDAPGELARLLASVAAAGAAHVYLLTAQEAVR
jgi:hypothetical protein